MNFQEQYENYKEENIFDTLKVNLNITSSLLGDGNSYLLSNVTVDKEEHTTTLTKSFAEKIKCFSEKLDTSVSYSKGHESWSVFYTFKELIDYISDNSSQDFRLFYRGQGGSWSLTPTLFRSGNNGGYSDEFRNNFEEIYKTIARKFPDRVKYEEPDSDERAVNLAEIQHYGLGTPLVDITENPFIAMQFMVAGYSAKTDSPEPQLDIFFCRKDGNNTLFQEVPKLQNNPRIIAQKGAFLNFEKLHDKQFDADKKISRVCIRIKYIAPLVNPSDADDLPDGDSDDVKQVNSEGESREDALISAVNDVQIKLRLYHYRSEDLFPDFYMYLNNLKLQYAQSDSKNNVYNVKENNSL